MADEDDVLSELLNKQTQAVARGRCEISKRPGDVNVSYWTLTHPSTLGHILRCRHRPISRLDVLDPVPQTIQIVCWQVGCIFHHVRCKKMHDTFIHMPAVLQCPSSPNLSAPLFSCGGSAYIQAFWPCFFFPTTNHKPPTTNYRSQYLCEAQSSKKCSDLTGALTKLVSTRPFR